ncbi:hypothetical protein [Nocardia seriolae]|nr:hypothetical protein [Nocardia seriolae]
MRTRLAVMAQQLWAGTGGIGYPDFVARTGYGPPARGTVGWP